MAVKKIEELNIHRDVNSTEQFDVQGYLNENWDKMQDVVDNNAEELMQAQKDISTLKEDNKTNKSSIDVLEKSNETRDEKISKNVEDIGIIQETIKSEKESIDKSLENINTKNEKQDEDIKANKESIEELQAENLEIKAENERLREDIKSIATIGEASGENIHLEDSSDARCEIEIDGNQKQDTREGYNFLDLSNFSTQTKNGVTATKNEDGSIKLVGTNSGDTFNINLSTINGEIGDYIASGVMGGSRETYFLGIVKPGVKTFAEVTNGSSNFSLTEETTIAANIYIIKGVTINTTIYPMMIKGTEDKPYEQYGASPSIDFLSELKAVGDDINILNDTIFARKGYYSGIVGATIQKANTTIRLLTDEDINVISNKDITISLGTDKDLKYNVFEIDENDVIIKNNMSSNNKDKTIKLQENTKKISLMLMWQDANKTITLEDIKDCKIKIAYGTSISNYSSYKCGSARVDFQNKNVFKPQIEADIGGTIVKNQEDTIVINGNSTTAHQINFNNKVNYKPNTNYKVTITKVSGSCTEFSPGKNWAMLFYASSKTTNIQIFPSSTTIKFSFVSPNGKFIPYLWFGFDSSSVVGTNGVFNNYTLKIQIEEENFSDYVSHQEQSYLVDVQQPMFEGDTFVRQENKWYEKHGFGVLDTFNNKNINISSTNIIEKNGKNFYRHHLVVQNDIKRKKGSYIKILSTHFKYNDSRWNTLEGICGWEAGNSFCIGTYDENYNTAEKMQTFLMNNHVKIYYELAESILLECTEAQSKVLDEIYSKAHTYKNITNISAESAEINPIVNVKYLKDTETEHNKLQAQINEIKELLSSTETSALLINNLEKDLRMEVE